MYIYFIPNVFPIEDLIKLINIDLEYEYKKHKEAYTLIIKP